jgi:hypothetical protein
MSESSVPTNKLYRNQIMAIGSQIRLSDSDPHCELDMYSYNSCSESDPEIIKKSNGIIFNKENIVIDGLPYIRSFKTSDDDLLPFLDSLDQFRTFLSHEGILLRIFYFKNKWFVSTNKKLNAFRSKWSSKDSYGNILKNAIDYLYSKENSDVFNLLKNTDVVNPYKSFLDTLDKDNIYLLLLNNTYENRIVCNSPEFPSVYHVGTFIDKKLNLDHNISLPKLQEKQFESNADLVHFVDEISVQSNPGVYVFDKNNTPYQISKEEYYKLCSIRGNEPSIKFRYLQIRMDREKVDMLYYLYPRFADQFDNYENILYECAKQINYNYIKRFIKKKYITVPREDYQIMKKCHEWHLQDRERNRISLTKIIEVMNDESSTILNRIIRKYKTEKESQQTRQQIRLLNPRAKSYGTPQIKPLILDPVDKVEQIKI